MKLLEWCWSWLPDNCQVHGCCRKGMRGNENHLPVAKDKYVIVCDYCSSANMNWEQEKAQYYQHPEGV